MDFDACLLTRVRIPLAGVDVVSRRRAAARARAAARERLREQERLRERLLRSFVPSGCRSMVLGARSVFSAGAAVLLRQLRETRQQGAASLVHGAAILVSQDENQARYAGEPAAGRQGPTCPALCLWAFPLRIFRTPLRGRSNRSRGAAQTAGCPGGLGVSTDENPVHVHEPSGISVRILGSEPHAHRRQDGRGHKARLGRVLRRGGASRTRE